MCFDLRKPEADRLARAIRDSDEMKRRGLLVGPASPPRDEAREANRRLREHQDWIDYLEGYPAMPPRDGPQGERAEHAGRHVVAIYGTANDGFAGSIGAKLAEERASREWAEGWAERVASAREKAEAEREARRARWRSALGRWVNRALWLILAWLILSFLAVGLWTPVAGGPLAPSPRPALPATGPPHAPGGAWAHRRCRHVNGWPRERFPGIPRDAP